MAKEDSSKSTNRGRVSRLAEEIPAPSPNEDLSELMRKINALQSGTGSSSPNLDVEKLAHYEMRKEPLPPETPELVPIGGKEGLSPPPSSKTPPLATEEAYSYSQVVQDLQKVGTEANVSTFESRIADKPKKLIEEYGQTRIYKVQGEILLYYWVPVARPTVSERVVINTLKEATTRLISITPYRIRDPEQKRNVYAQQVLEILRASPELKVPSSKFGFYATAVVTEMVGYGLVDSLIKDDNLEEVMIIGPNVPVYVFHRKYDMMTTNVEFTADNEIQDLINRIAREIGRRVDISSPMLDARLPDGSRVNATIPPASVSGSTLTVRKFRAEPFSVVDLILNKTMSAEVAAFLWLCVDGLLAQPANLLISGGTSSGKTTLLNVLCSFIPPMERVISIEDTSELNLPLKHWIRLEGRPPGLEGKGEITLDILTKNSLRMRPDRIIVGEVRHDEAFSLFTAMNTGHDGMAAPETLVQFDDGSIKPMGAFCEDYFSALPIISKGDMEAVYLPDDAPSVVAVNKFNLKQEKAKVKAIWRRKCHKSYRVVLSSGREIKLSHDHPVFRLKDGFLQQVQAREVRLGDYLGAIGEFVISGQDADEHASYFVGLVLGGGHLRKDVVSFTNRNERLHRLFLDSANKAFGVVGKTYPRKNEISVSMINSASFAKSIHEHFGIPFGNKTKIFDVPLEIEKSSLNCVGFFLRGMFDTGGSVSSIRKSICLSTANPNVLRKVPLLLKLFGVESRINVQQRDGRGNAGPYYRIFITGEKNLQAYHENIGFGHSEKRAKLVSILGVKSNTNVDLVPDVGLVIQKARKGLDFTQKELSMKAGLGKSRSMLNAYEAGSRSPSRETLRKVVRVLIDRFNDKAREFGRYDYGLADAKESEGLKSIRSLITHLNALSNGHIIWDRVKTITVNDEDSLYYDLTLDTIHTFTANGVVISNCMGTIHANSAEETLTRVTNPPMNVPGVMLSGLNFVIIENLFHSATRGSYRRVTEIAEVTGVLEGKAHTQPIFSWDAVKDELVRNNTPIKYLDRVSALSGRSVSEIEMEFKRRERFLQGLVDRNVRSLKTVSMLAEEFVGGE